MIDIPRYSIENEIARRKGVITFSGWHDETMRPVVIKFFLTDEVPILIQEKLKDEFKKFSYLDSKHLLSLYDWVEMETNHISKNSTKGFAVVYEKTKGLPLKEYLTLESLSIFETLEIAIGIVSGLDCIHQVGICHQRLTPYNIFIEPRSKQVKLTNFSFFLFDNASVDNYNSAFPILTHFKNEDCEYKILPYISPEQTGRVKCIPDNRSDLYSLGAILYEIITSKILFSNKKTAELIYCQIAECPSPPVQMNKEIPVIVSNIVMKLLEKNPNSRYQSAYGVKADIECCLNAFQRGENSPIFRLGQNDIPNQIEILSKMYGREKELQQIQATFEKVKNGNKGMTFVTGHSGIGKTVLIREFIKRIQKNNESNTKIITGKFDEVNQSVPYSALAQAFRNLVQQLLRSDDEEFQYWRSKLSDALTENGRLIIDLIPEMEMIIGPQPDVPKLGPTEEQNRFRIVLLNFIRVFCHHDKHFVIFIDDLQWADLTSLKLLERLNERDIPYLFFIGAYRNNEVNDSHPLSTKLRNFKNDKTLFDEIVLKPLALENITQLIADTLLRDFQSSKNLSILIEENTDGNPFLIREFLTSLHKEKLIQFDSKINGWRWDLSEVNKHVPKTAANELILSKVRGLGNDDLLLLKTAACIGNKFNLPTLSLILGKDESQIALQLNEFINRGLIIPVSNDEKGSFCRIPDQLSIDYFRFAHDRVIDAIYSLIPETEKANIHAHIGQFLLTDYKTKKDEDKIFDLINHLNLGKSSKVFQNDSIILVQLNLEAAYKAKKGGAYEAELECLQKAICLITDKTWADDYNLCFEIYLMATEAAYLCGQFEQMESIATIAITYTQNRLDIIKIQEIRIMALNAQEKLQDAIEVISDTLKITDVYLPRNPDKKQVVIELIKIKFLLVNRKIENLADLPTMTDPIKKLAMRVLVLSWGTYFAAPNLMIIIICRLIALSIKYGNSNESFVGYSTFGLLLCSVTGEIEKGYRFGKLAINLFNQVESREHQAKVILVMNSFIRPWKEHTVNSLPYLKEGYQVGLNWGDFGFAALCIHLNCTHAVYIGAELTSIEKEIYSATENIEILKQKTIYHAHTMLHQLVQNLIGKNDNPHELIGDSYNESEMLPLYQKENNQNGLFNIYLIRIWLCNLFEKKHEAVFYASIAEKYLDGAIGMILVPFFHFQAALAHLALYPNANKIQKLKILIKTTISQIRMRRWARFAPENYLHKFYLVEAELFRVRGNSRSAIDYYTKSIALAKSNRYIHEEALANELTAKFYLLQNNFDKAKTFILEALLCYRKWGATAKVKHLKDRYSDLLSSELQFKRSSETQITNIKVFDDNLDLATIINASQAIAEETDIVKLLDKLMRLVIKNAGARKGILILKKDDGFVVEAQVFGKLSQNDRFNSLPLENFEELPKSIVTYVIRTGKDVILSDANVEWTYSKDAYINREALQSVFCIPILHLTKRIGALYLENNMISGAFTPERVKVLKAVTDILAAAWAKKQAEYRLNNYQKKLRSLSSEVQLAEEKERRKLAMGLHDQIGHSLTSISMKLKEIHSLSLPEEADRIIGQIQKINEQTIKNTQTLTFELSPPILYDLGLESAIDWLAENAQEKYNFVVEVDNDMIPQEIDNAIRILIFQSVRELLFNVAKHAKASHVKIDIIHVGDTIKIEIKDNGIGFDATHLNMNKIKKGGFGLFSIKERLKNQGGNFIIKSTPGEGTTIIITSPIVYCGD